MAMRECRRRFKSLANPGHGLQNVFMTELDRILAEIANGESAQAARREWNPRQRGEIDIRIAADGSWFHQGRRFQRESLVRLFAGVLRREADNYYLVTPTEKLRIEVEDAPFVATMVERIDDGGRDAIVFTTSLGERIVVDREHPLRIETDPASGTPRPYVRVRDGIDALIGRGAFYDLVNLAATIARNGSTRLVVSSMGDEFELGTIDEQPI